MRALTYHGARRKIGASGIPINKTATPVLEADAGNALSATGGTEHIEGSDAPQAAAAIDALYGGNESGSWLTTKLPDNTIVHADSAVAVNLIATTNTSSRWLNGVSNGNFTSVVHVVPLGQPMVQVVPKSNAAQSYAVALQLIMGAGFPIPPSIDPFPPADTDAELIVIQPDWTRTIGGVTRRGRMYELWVTKHPATSPSGKWEASWGGRYVNCNQDERGHWFDFWWGDAAAPNDWTADGIAMDHNWGAQATSIPLVGGLVTRLDIIRGIIKHPIAFMLPAAAQADQAGPVWPAQRWDGASRIICPQGSRFRLPAGFTVNPSWPWLTQRLVEAARDYGLVFTDTTGPSTGPTFRLEPGAAPLVPGGVSISAVMNAFPWTSLQRMAVGSDSNPNPTA